MTNEEKLVYLRSYRQKGREIKLLAEEKASWEKGALKGHAQKIIRDIEEEMQELCNQRKRIVCAIEKIDDNTQREILYRRYIGPYISVRQLAQRLYISENGYHRAHRKAIKKLEI